MRWTFETEWFVKRVEINGNPCVLFACANCKTEGYRKERSSYTAKNHYGTSQFGNKIHTGRTYYCNTCGFEETAKREN